MKDQYVGDINDYRKYALLRALAGPGNMSIGVCWMLTPPDGRTDGRMTEYLRQPGRWRAYDPELFDLLSSVIGEPGRRRLVDIEESGILPGARYCNDVVPDDIAGRAVFFQRSSDLLGGCDLVFFDPDNGLDVPSKRKGQMGSSKFIYRDEVAAAYRRGQSVLVYQHFARQEREGFVTRIGCSLAELMPGAALWAFRTSHVVFFLAGQPQHRTMLEAKVEALEARSAGLFAQVKRLMSDESSLASGPL